MYIKEPYSPRALIVDDSPAAADLLKELLYNSDFIPQSVETGKFCLDEVKTVQPDIILLDYKLPDIDGPEVCRLLKKDPATRAIPVIFLSENRGNAALIEAFAAGAADYVTKPFNFIELSTRMRTQIELRCSQDRLTQMNKELQNLNAEKDEMLSVVAHDLKNPISAIQSLAEILKGNHDFPEAEKMDLIDNIHKSTVYMLGLVENLLEMNSFASGAMNLKVVAFDWIQLTERCIHANLSRATQKKQIIQFFHEDEELSIISDERIIFRIIDNLLSNAIKFSPQGRNIHLSVSREADGIICSVSDQGPGLSDTDKEKLFEKFTRLSARPTGGESSTGLGLSIVHKLVKTLKGEVWCESVLGNGSTFFLKIPSLYCEIPLPSRTPAEATEQYENDAPQHTDIVLCSKINRSKAAPSP